MKTSAEFGARCETRNTLNIMLARLSQPRVLWVALFVTIILSVTFPVVELLFQIPLIDAIVEPDLVRQIIAEMTPHQRARHAWITATLDVVYPLAYGSLFVGSALALYERFGGYLAAVLFFVIPVDLLEGVVQVLALSGQADLIDAKAFLTPLKFALFLTGLTLTIVGWVVRLMRRLRSDPSAREPKTD